MQRTTSLLILLLTALAALSGYLLSKASLVGKAGITLFYKQYGFLKVWWQGALVVFIIWIFLFGLQDWAARRAKGNNTALAHVAAIVVALIGLFFTYQDFRNNLSHRVLGERFHLGGYLFWAGWIIISLYYLFKTRSLKKTA